jgi:Cu(I)/Ag(I) efflux system membrane protein CusA/SilA
MIERTIAWCSRNRFIVLLATAALAVAGFWSLKRIPLDALPDISDVQVIVHTQWMGQPPSLIEDQVTYPIVTTMLAAPHVKAVRAQTMSNDSSCSKTAPTSIGLEAACSNICNKSPASYQPG